MQGEIQLPLSDCGVVALDYRGKAGIATAIGHAPKRFADPAAGSVLSVAESLTNIVWAPLAEGWTACLSLPTGCGRAALRKAKMPVCTKVYRLCPISVVLWKSTCLPEKIPCP